jgi:hypothetical protein
VRLEEARNTSGAALAHALPPAISSGPDLPPLGEYELVHKVPIIRLAGEESKVISEEIELVIWTRVMQIATEQNLPTHVRDFLERKLIRTSNQMYL